MVVSAVLMVVVVVVMVVQVFSHNGLYGEPKLGLGGRCRHHGFRGRHHTRVREVALSLGDASPRSATLGTRACTPWWRTTRGGRVRVSMGIDTPTRTRASSPSLFPLTALYTATGPGRASGRGWDGGSAREPSKRATHGLLHRSATVGCRRTATACAIKATRAGRGGASAYVGRPPLATRYPPPEAAGQIQEGPGGWELGGHSRHLSDAQVTTLGGSEDFSEGG